MNQNSALIWLPAIQSAGLPTPRTIVVPYCHRDCIGIFDGPGAEDSAVEAFRKVVTDVSAAVAEIGPPAFVRTDLSSAKHAGRSAWLAHEEIAQTVHRLIEDNEMKFWLERDGPQAILVRQFLRLPAPFTGFNGLPISREWRYFADGDRVICQHPYWPHDAFEEWGPDETAPKNWRDLLTAMHEPPAGEEAQLLKEMAICAARSCGGAAWSVDFAQDGDGKWWLLDMARMECSWHWPDCRWNLFAGGAQTEHGPGFAMEFGGVDA